MANAIVDTIEAIQIAVTSPAYNIDGDTLCNFNFFAYYREFVSNVYVYIFCKALDGDDAKAIYTALAETSTGNTGLVSGLRDMLDIQNSVLLYQNNKAGKYVVKVENYRMTYKDPLTKLYFLQPLIS